MRESRVRNPFLRSAGRSSGLNTEMARARPMRTAPACPPTPPPLAVMTTSTWSWRLVNFNGSVASCFHAKFGKYCSAVRPFTVNLPEPARRNTRATDSLRRPVPRIHVCLPMMGEPVELNVPPKIYFERHVVRVSQKSRWKNPGDWNTAGCETHENNNPRTLPLNNAKQSRQLDSLTGYGLRLLACMTRQTRGVAIHAQFPGAARAQFILGQ